MCTPGGPQQLIVARTIRGDWMQETLICGHVVKKHRGTGGTSCNYAMNRRRLCWECHRLGKRGIHKPTQEVIRKLVRNMRDPSARKYWEQTLITAEMVSKWPAWKRGAVE